MPKVSVIIPVYNVEQYLRECLDSVINQTLKDIEIICVDDGSTDNSRKILDNYALNDSRIKVLNGEKKGAGAARNIGLKNACGDYLSFLDSDDFFELDMLEKMYNKSIETESDIVICEWNKYNMQNNNYYYSSKKHIPTLVLENYKTFSYKDIPNDILNYFSHAPWNKLFKRSFIIESGINYQEIKRSNDVYFTRCALVTANKISYVNEYLVHYRIGHETNLQNTNYKTPLEFTKALIELKKYLSINGYYDYVKSSYKKMVRTVTNHNINTLMQHPDIVCFIYLYMIFYILPKINVPLTMLSYKCLVKSILRLIFSIKNAKDKRHKIITILGFKIKFKRREKNAKS